MNQKIKLSKFTSISVGIVLIIFLFNIIINFNITAPNWYDSDYGKKLDIEFDIYKNGEKIATSSLPYTFKEVPIDNKIELIGTLPNESIINNSFISFRSSGFSVNAQIDNNQVYEYSHDGKNDLGGGYWHFIGLPEDSQNKQLKLSFCCPADNPLAIHIYPINIGSKGYLLRESFQFKYQSILFGIVLLSFGFVFLGSVIFVNHSISNPYLFSLSLLLFCFGSWVLFQSGARQLIGVNNTVTPMIISFFDMFSLPFCLWYYLKSNYKSINNYKILKFGAYFLFLLYIPISLISFFGIAYTHFLLLIGLLLAIYVLILFVILLKIYFNGDKNLISAIIAISSILISIIAENILLYFNIVIQSISLLHLAMAIASMIFIYRSIGNLVKKNNEINEAKLIKKMAYIDGVTLVKNRNAYEKFINEEYKNHETFGIIFSDLNGLKIINDKKGHKFGDSLLKDYAIRLNKLLPLSSNIYRVGGDEFIAFVFNISEQEFNDIINELKEEFKPTNTSFGLSIGSSFFNYKEDKNLTSKIDLADKKMYKHKDYIKNNFNNNFESYLAKINSTI